MAALRTAAKLTHAKYGRSSTAANRLSGRKAKAVSSIAPHRTKISTSLSPYDEMERVDGQCFQDTI
jgi:hypothetical protein